MAKRCPDLGLDNLDDFTTAEALAAINRIARFLDDAAGTALATAATTTTSWDAL